MKKTFLSLAIALSAAGMLLAKGSSEPVLMTIKGKPVTLSEFEYLYHKNNSQQVAPQSIEDYLQMFITYKQKVADAEAAGIDQSQAFRNEFDGYRRELAEPYLRVQEVEDSILTSLYDRMKEDVDVSHIMVASRAPQVDPEEQRTRLDSIRTAIQGGADFAQLARRFSIDRSAATNGGHMGYISAGRLPFKFEDAAYTTPVGQISPIVETPFGFHIVKVHGRRPAQGLVLVEHILKLTQGLPENEAAVKKAQIDSIAALVAAGADFEDIASRESDDPGSKRNGGKLQWFGTGQMVPEFEAMAFKLKNGEVSEPFRTGYGYHIVKRLDWKGIDPYEKMVPTLKNIISQDERAQLPRIRKVAQLRKKYNAAINAANLARVKNEIITAGLDSTLQARYLQSNMPLATVNKVEIPLSEIISEAINDLPMASMPQADHVEAVLNKAIDNMVIENEREALAVENPDYRNLLNEYRDGMMLFEIADRNVWSKAKQDKEGLEAFFQANRAKYTWDKPRYKGYVVFATSDSVLNLAKAHLAASEIPSDSLATSLRRAFGKDVKIEKVIAAQGENNITDFLGFGAPKPEAKGKWAFYFPYRDKVLEAPEEAADVRGAVTGDYQTLLEEQWVAALKKKYPVKLKKKVLKQAK